MVHNITAKIGHRDRKRIQKYRMVILSFLRTIQPPLQKKIPAQSRTGRGESKLGLCPVNGRGNIFNGVIVHSGNIPSRMPTSSYHGQCYLRSDPVVEANGELAMDHTGTDNFQGQIVDHEVGISHIARRLGYRPRRSGYCWGSGGTGGGK